MSVLKNKWTGQKHFWGQVKKVKKGQKGRPGVKTKVIKYILLYYFMVQNYYKKKLYLFSLATFKQRETTMKYI